MIRKRKGTRSICGKRSEDTNKQLRIEWSLREMGRRRRGWGRRKRSDEFAFVPTSNGLKVTDFGCKGVMKLRSLVAFNEARINLNLNMTNGFVVRVMIGVEINVRQGLLRATSLPRRHFHHLKETVLFTSDSREYYLADEIQSFRGCLGQNGTPGETGTLPTVFNHFSHIILSHHTHDVIRRSSEIIHNHFNLGQVISARKNLPSHNEFRKNTARWKKAVGDCVAFYKFRFRSLRNLKTVRNLYPPDQMSIFVSYVGKVNNNSGARYQRVITYCWSLLSLWETGWCKWTYG